jgi:ribosome-associated translation inhibitor RaiA
MSPDGPTGKQCSMRGSVLDYSDGRAVAGRHRCGRIVVVAMERSSTGMQIQVNTDNRVEGSIELREHATSVIESALTRFGAAVTRVEVHLTDVNGHKAGVDDKRCVIEARLAGRNPVAVTDNAATFVQAISSAADKLQRKLDSTLGRLSRR